MGNKRNTYGQKGDTLIEILLVTAILGLIAIGASSLMSRAFAGTQQALDQTTARQAVEGQVEMLTFARDQSIIAPASPAAGAWAQAVAKADTSVSPYGTCLSGTDTSRFYMQMNSGAVGFGAPPAPAVAAATTGEGVWVEGYRPSPIERYIDFHVYGCWPTSNGPNATTGTVVRLYVP